MASVSGSNAAETNTSVPQWKKDLIQRRRQQNKGVVSNVPAAGNQQVSSSDVTNASSINNISESQCTDASYLTGSELSREDKKLVQVNSTLVNEVTRSGAGIGHTNTNECELSGECSTGTVPSVACNMRLEATERLCPTTEDTLKTLKNHNTQQHNMEFDNCEVEHTNYTDNKKYHNDPNDTTSDLAMRAAIQKNSKSVIKNETSVCVYTDCRKSRIDRFNKNVTTLDNNGKGAPDDCESDSSEELQYGPGIVNKLKSKYLNLTLREMNKTRMSVQRFRRAASLEDLLDSNHDNEKATRKFTKKSTPPGVAAKTERFRNLSRGNESMKRARSVETLMRYQQPDEQQLDNNKHIPLSRLSGIRQEPVNDHIVLIDRTTVKIENKLLSNERPKTLNKPKKIKPLLADTERPPPDLVKTTMRIFESSVKKLKPKGEVAAKVATFKTINDTYKAQAMKKVIPKPPIQPKPAINGNSKVAGYTKTKNLEVIKPTAELIEHPDEKYKNDGVATDPIVQSVSSVVYKFQQIEKSSSQSPSPEPIHNKLRSASAASPEPLSTKTKSNSEGCAKAVPIVLCSVANRKDTSPRSNFTSLQQMPPNSCRETSCHAPISEISEISSTIQAERENTLEIEKITESPRSPEQTEEPLSHFKSIEEKTNSCSSEVDNKTRQDDLDPADDSNTVEFNFGDESSLSKKSHLPRTIVNDQDPGRTINGVTDVNSTESENAPANNNLKASDSSVSNLQAVCKIEEEKEFGMEEDNMKQVQPVHIPESKPIGAISSLGLIKTPNTNSSSANKDSKLMKPPKSETSPAQKQIGIIRPLVSTKAQISQQNLSNRELEKNLINRVKSIEQPTKVVVSVKSADEIQPVKIASFSGATTSEVGGGNGGSSGGSGGGGGLWDTKPWNQQNNTMVFNFSNRKDVPDYIENDGLIIRRKRDKSKVADGGIIVLDATIDASTTDGNEWELAGGPPSPCDVTFTNDNILINGRSNLTKTPKNHKNRIQFNDEATRTFEYPSEASMLDDDSNHSAHTSLAKSDGDDCQSGISNKSMSTTGTSASPILGGGGLASYTPSKVDLASDGFELGITRSTTVHPPTLGIGAQVKSENSAEMMAKDEEHQDDSHDTAAWGVETTADLLY